jgi:UDP-N-acetylmuramoyl-tripeptide--D-alanyl-D-alanine ligase
MEARSIQYVAAACGGELLNGSPDALALRVSTDSRQVGPGDLFFALAGERFDGHDYLAEVARKGAAAVVVQSGRAHAGLRGSAVIEVDNPRRALGRLAEKYRKEFELRMVAVGGSNGKTTTKEILASVLRQKLSTLWSEASFNNDIGVPLTLLKLETAHQAAVLEAGTNHPGELEPLVRMIQPRYGVLTSIGREHLEFFGTLEGVAQEEGWLAELLPAGGKLFINGDSEWAAGIINRSRAQAFRIGFAETNDWRVRSVRTDKQGVSFRIDAPLSEFAGDYKLPLVGRHQAINALLAIAVAAEFGLSRAEIERGLAECRAPKMRLQVWEFGGVRVLDDAYNANADSVIAALEALKDMPCKGRRVAVLGDMAELGQHSEAAHEEVGRRVAELGVGQLFAVGKMAPVIARGARQGGMNRVLEFSNIEAAAAAVKSFVKNGDVLLLKASRSSRLERISELLRGGESAKKNHLSALAI